MTNLENINRETLIRDIKKLLSLFNGDLFISLQANINIWSTKELLQIHEYLETGSLNPLYVFLEDKKQEYLNILSEIKGKKRLANLNDIKLRERLDLDKEKEEIELIDFNF